MGHPGAPAGSVADPGIAGRAAVEEGARPRILVSRTTDPAENLGLEEAILRQVEAGDRPDTLRLWVNDECLVRGRHRARGGGWHHEALARAMGVRLLVRSTGGGTVFHDRGNLNWSFTLRRAAGYASARGLFAECAEVIAGALRSLGVPATFAPPNRLDAAGRKISGMAARATAGAVLVHGTLLVATDLSRLEALCIPPPGCPAVGRLCDIVPGLTVAQVVLRLRETAAG